MPLGVSAYHPVLFSSLPKDGRLISKRTAGAETQSERDSSEQDGSFAASKEERMFANASKTLGAFDWDFILHHGGSDGYFFI